MKNIESVTLLCLVLLACELCASRDVYSEVTRLLLPEEDYLSAGALRSFFTLLQNRVQCGGVSCGKCLSEENAGQLVSNFSSSSGLDTEAFFRVAAGSCLFLSAAPTTCTAIQEGCWAQETDRFIQSFLDHDDHRMSHGNRSSPGRVGLGKLLHDMQKYYIPRGDSKHCLSLTDILEESNMMLTDSGHQHADHHTDLETVFGVIVYHALLGDCMSAHSLPEEEFFLEYIYKHFGQDNLTLQGLYRLMLKLGHMGGRHNDDHEHKHSPESVVEEEPGAGYAGEGCKQDLHLFNSSWDTACFTATELLRIYNLNSSGLTREEFTRLSPALIQQILSKACSGTSPTTEPPVESLSTTELYLYTTLARTVIFLISMFGVGMLLCTSGTALFQLCIQFCISMAVSSMTGDALLHLLPVFLGLHAHRKGASDGHDHSEETNSYTFKLLVLIGGIYCFYLMESIFTIITHNSSRSHHSEEEEDPHHCDHGKVLQMYQRERKSKFSTSQADLDDGESTVKPSDDAACRTREQRLLPYMINISDSLHNFADGLAIGAAFSLSWRSGLATSLAVLCHEVPHVLGDFAIMLHCGWSIKKALLINFGITVVSFIGLFIVLSVSTDTVATEWILAVAAGLFLYVGLADMLPTLIHVDSKRPWMMFTMQNLGLLTGWGILLLMSFYEDKMGF